jgi:hypothetical protein
VSLMSGPRPEARDGQRQPCIGDATGTGSNPPAGETGPRPRSGNRSGPARSGLAKFAFEDDGDTVFIVRARDFIGYGFRVVVSVAHRHAMTGPGQHLDVVGHVSKGDPC